MSSFAIYSCGFPISNGKVGFWHAHIDYLSKKVLDEENYFQFLNGKQQNTIRRVKSSFFPFSLPLMMFLFFCFAMSMGLSSNIDALNRLRKAKIVTIYIFLEKKMYIFMDYESSKYLNRGWGGVRVKAASSVGSRTLHYIISSRDKLRMMAGWDGDGDDSIGGRGEWLWKPSCSSNYNLWKFMEKYLAGLCSLC